MIIFRIFNHFWWNWLRILPVKDFLFMLIFFTLRIKIKICVIFSNFFGILVIFQNFLLNLLRIHILIFTILFPFKIFMLIFFLREFKIIIFLLSILQCYILVWILFRLKIKIGIFYHLFLRASLSILPIKGFSIWFWERGVWINPFKILSFLRCFFIFPIKIIIIFNRFNFFLHLYIFFIPCFEFILVFLNLIHLSFGFFFNLTLNNSLSSNRRS